MPGAMLIRRYGDGARRHPGRDRQVANRRRLFRHAEVLGLPAGTGAGFVQRPGRREDSEAQREGAELVPRCLADRQLLGQRSRVSSHRADQHDLRAARSVAAGARRRARTLASRGIARITGAQGRSGGDRASNTPRKRVTSCRSSTRCEFRAASTMRRFAKRCWNGSASRSAPASGPSRARSGGSA